MLCELRYYEQLPYKTETIKQTKLIKEKLNQVEKLLIEKACIGKILTTFSKESNLNYQILRNQFDSKIINLNNTNYILKYNKGILEIQIYDTNIEEETKELKIAQKTELLVKLNKKIKVWE